MDLFEWNEFKIGGTECGLKEAAILTDVFPRVPFHETEVEDFFRFERADSAGSGAETVDQPGKLRKRDEFKNLQATSLAKAPGRSDTRGRGRRGHRLARATPPHGSFSGSHNQTSIIATAGTEKSAERAEAAARGANDRRHGN